MFLRWRFSGFYFTFSSKDDHQIPDYLNHSNFSFLYRIKLIKSLCIDQGPSVVVTNSSPAKARPHPLSISNVERQQMMMSPNNKMDPLTPSKRSHFECSVSSGSPSQSRQRARTVGSAGGETMKREIAKRRLAKLNEEANLVEVTKDETSPRVTIFKKTAVNGSTPVSLVHVRSSRQEIFQVRTSIASPLIYCSQWTPKCLLSSSGSRPCPGQLQKSTTSKETHSHSQVSRSGPRDWLYNW